MAAFDYLIDSEYSGAPGDFFLFNFLQIFAGGAHRLRDRYVCVCTCACVALTSTKEGSTDTPVDRVRRCRATTCEGNDVSRG